MTPISHALPVDPPPPRTNALEVKGSVEEGVVFRGLLKFWRARWDLITPNGDCGFGHTKTKNPDRLGFLYWCTSY
jgi:hypothetical protein